jgi:putative radical SAM enzyme (TIGR03279 family)
MKKGIKIIDVSEKGLAFKMGIRANDRLCRINNHPVKDVIDYLFYGQDEYLTIDVMRNDTIYTFEHPNEDGHDPGISLSAIRIKRCRNNCIFCFVNQLPEGLRKSLYVKDDDYRLSFLYGNYITLTNLSQSCRDRIIRQRLSPLYVSVHTTNNDMRRIMIGNPAAHDILEEIEYFTSRKIRFHTQIVLCPGINDGEELCRTIKNLYKFYPYVASIAVVPVGLTDYASRGIRPFTQNDAHEALKVVSQFGKRFKRRHGEPIVYGSDELYLMANAPLPYHTYYGDFDQIENGVGLIASFLRDSKKLKLPKKIDPLGVTTITGVSFWPYLQEVLQKFRTIEGLSIDAYKIENILFGSSVTVTGLLSGRSIIKGLLDKELGDIVLIPDVTLKSDRPVFLDDVTIKDMEKILKVKVIPIESTPEGILQGIIKGKDFIKKE